MHNVTSWMVCNMHLHSRQMLSCHEMQRCHRWILNINGMVRIYQEYQDLPGIFDMSGDYTHDVNSLWPSDTIWRYRSGSTLAQVMARCLTAPSHYLNQCWLIISEAQWQSHEGNFTRDASAINYCNQLENYLPKISLKSPRGQWVNLPFWIHAKIVDFLVRLWDPLAMIPMSSIIRMCQCSSMSSHGPKQNGWHFIVYTFSHRSSWKEFVLSWFKFH